MYIVVVDRPVPAGRRYVTKTTPIAMPSGEKVQLALIVHKDAGRNRSTRSYLTHIGVSLRSANQKASTYDTRIKLEELFDIVPSSLECEHVTTGTNRDNLAHLLTTRSGDVVAVQSEVAASVLDSIARLRPGMGAVIDWLEALRNSDELGFTEREILWREHRDAINLGLRIGGFSSTPLRAWRRPSNNQPFVAGVVPYPRPRTLESNPSASPTQIELPGEGYEQSATGREELYHPRLAGLANPTEPRLIDHDARAFPGWSRQRTPEMHVHVFADGNRRMEIINIDASGVEARTGADLIYYHVNTESFVLVQYKRLVGRSYPVDERLVDQLNRMERLAKLNRNPTRPHEWRIGPEFSFLKLADIKQKNVPPDRLVNGLYLSTSYTRMLLAENLTRLGYDSVERHLSNQQFIDLVAHGLIGTVGVSVEQIRDIITGLLDNGESVVIAKDVSNETLTERQRRRRSRSATPAR
ncbi:hypothetical protein ABT297_32720 [Dactylosporangium sp. NPDC000555]|uniref:hypothetical protein n=1 Tax=Dactylosporangium sp. NPDC000555 TaxID=3154260 RepID=UPI00332825B7